MTSGSFMMMQAGAFEEEEESQYELGEAPDANRGAASVALGENDQNRDGSEAGFWRRRRRTPSGSSGSSCSGSTKITSEAECRQAATAKGLSFKGTETSSGYPSGCYKY